MSGPASRSFPSAVSFGGEISGDRSNAEAREWLITNGLGSYGRGTVAGSLTRSYHGLLVAALGALAPAGHPWIVSFRLEGRVPTWRYALGDALLENLMCSMGPMATRRRRCGRISSWRWR